MAEVDLRNSLHSAGRQDGTFWKAGSTMLVMDYNLHSEADNSPARLSPALAMRNCGWTALEVFTPPENRSQENITNFATAVKRAGERLRSMPVDNISRTTVHVHLSLHESL